jgi:hypothetical protein
MNLLLPLPLLLQPYPRELQAVDSLLEQEQVRADLGQDLDAPDSPEEFHVDTLDNVCSGWPLPLRRGSKRCGDIATVTEIVIQLYVVFNGTLRFANIQRNRIVTCAVHIWLLDLGDVMSLLNKVFPYVIVTTAQNAI